MITMMRCEPSLSWTWTLLSPSPSTSSGTAPRVSGHVAATDFNNDYVFVFGGLTGNAGSPCTNQLWSLAAHDNHGWKQIESATTAADADNAVVGPGPRMYSAAAILYDHFYIMGGWDPGAPKSGGTFLDDVWSFPLSTTAHNDNDDPSPKTVTWNRMQQSLPCGPVSRHAACTVGGGTMIVVHTFRGIVVLTRTNANTNDMEWREQPTTGPAPDGKSMCAMAPLTDTSLLVFGGSTKTQQLSADAHVLDTTTWTWTQLDCSSTDSEHGDGSRPSSPSPRASPCAARLRDNQCVIFGGASLGSDGYQGGAGLQAQGDAWILTVHGDKGTWNRIDTTTASDGSPKPRLAAILTSLNDGSLLLHGGWDPAGETFQDTWILREK